MKLNQDIIIHKKIKAHRLILAGASSYFEKLFLGPWSEEESKAVVVVDMIEITFEVLQMLVNFIYTDEMQFTQNCTVRSAIIAADYLMMDGAIEELSEQATKNIQDETVFEIYEVSDKLSPKVKGKLITFIRKGLNNERIQKGLPALPFDKFEALVHKDETDPVDEYTAVLSIKAWVLHDNRTDYVLDLLKSVDYSFQNGDKVSVIAAYY